MKKPILLILGVVVLFNILGCETIKGIGKDISNTGQNIYEGVQKVENHGSTSTPSK